jgi:xenotropic and polytropic retrovirus receptor 1
VCRVVELLIGFNIQVDSCAFASDETVQQLLKEMEVSFTARFGRGLVVINFISILIISYVAKGDRKRALVRLRAGSSLKTHHFSTFRTGIALGLAFPAVIDGIVRCESSNNSAMLAEHLSGLQPHTRVDIPSWGSLLFIYANLLVPTLLALLVGTNMLIWTASRINYVFIFGTVSQKFSAMSKNYL